MKKRFYILTLSALVFNANSILAQKTAKTDSIKSLTISETVITAQYAPTSTVKSIYKTKVIGVAEIQAKAANTLQDLLRYELNFTSSNDAVLGSAINVQGIGGENVKILIDGVAIAGRQNGQIDLSQISLANVERIEIVEGSQSVNFGSNAAGGVINIITKKQSNSTNNIRFNTYYETVGQYNVDALYAHNFKKGHTASASIGRNFFDGDNAQNQSSRVKLWKPKEVLLGNLSYGYNGKNTSINLRTQNSQATLYDRGEPRAPSLSTAFDDYFITLRSNIGLDYTQKFNAGKSTWTSILGYSLYQRKQISVLKDLVSLQENEINTGQTPDQYDAKTYRSTLNFPIMGKNFQVGSEGNFETANGDKIKNLQQRINEIGIIAGYEYTYKKLQLRPSTRYIYNSVYQAPIIWAVNARYSIGERTYLRASAGQGYRAPSVRELFFEFVDVNHRLYGNTALKAEKSINYTLSFNYLKTIGKYIYKTESNFFYNRINNLITLAQADSNKFIYQNISEFSNFGYQFSNEFLKERFRIQSAFGITGSISSYNHTPVYHPSATAGVVYRLPKIGTEFASFIKYEGKAPYFRPNNGSVEQGIIAPYTTLDANVSHTCWKNRLTLKVGAKNILNVTQVSTGSNATGGVHGASGNQLISFGRTYFAGLSFNLEK